MDLSDIVMLEAIVKHGSISKASEVLHITQPTLSKRLSRLEYTLGTTLFERNSTGLSPTPHTVFIIDSAQQIQHRIKSIERHIELHNMLEAGELNLGVGPIVEQLYFPHALLELAGSKSSKMSIAIRTETSEDLVQLLTDGDIDIAVGPFEQSSSSEEYQIYPVANQPLVIAISADHPLADAGTSPKEPPNQDEVFQYTLIAPHVPAYMGAQFPYLEELDSPRIICDNYAVIREVLKESHHISIGPGAVFSKDVEDGSLVLLPMPVPIRWYASCIARPENASLPAIKRVIDVFRNYELPVIQ